MDKILLLTTCKACRGVTYLTTPDENGHATCQPCFACQGSGTQLEWVDLREFARLLSAITAEINPPRSWNCNKTPQITAVLSTSTRSGAVVAPK
jgi:uncharacterized OB-fold protein